MIKNVFTWNRLQVTVYSLADKPMKRVLNATTRKPRLWSPPGTPANKAYIRCIAVAAVTIGADTVYLIFPPFGGIQNTATTLSQTSDLPYSAYLIVYNERCHHFLEPTFELIQCALRKRVSPSVYALIKMR
jgi:hypothetical protein